MLPGSIYGGTQSQGRAAEAEDEVPPQSRSEYTFTKTRDQVFAGVLPTLGWRPIDERLQVLSYHSDSRSMCDLDHVARLAPQSGEWRLCE